MGMGGYAKPENEPGGWWETSLDKPVKRLRTLAKDVPAALSRKQDVSVVRSP